MLANVYQNHHRWHYFLDQNLKQTFIFTQMLREFSAWMTKIENFSWVNNSRSVHAWIVFSNITGTNNSSIKSMRIECKIISLNIVLYRWKLRYFTRSKIHLGSNLFPQVDYTFTITRSLSIAIFIINQCLWHNLKTANICTMSLGSFALDGSVFASAVTRCTSQN